LYPKYAPKRNLFLLLFRYASSGGKGKEESVIVTPKNEEKTVAFVLFHIAIPELCTYNIA